MNDLLDITLAFKEALKLKIGGADSTFNLWFGDLNLLEFNGETAIFSTPTKLRRQILLARYFEDIKETLFGVLGFEVKIEIISADNDNDFTPPTRSSSLPISEENPEESLEKERQITAILGNTDPNKHTILDEYTFDNFIEGESNKFAKAACYAVANEPCSYNPLFIHGQSGLGKTHLLYAIMNHMKKNNPHLKIVYKKSETFINELIEAIGNGQTAPFKEKYRSADVLLIDDIQFLAGKESTQEEFFHTFSTLYEAEKQIILTSDRPPMDIKPLTDRLRTRFEGGLIADVKPPSLELRTAIIRKKSMDMGIHIPSDIILYMADRLISNIRQIEGVLKKLSAVYALTGKEITKEQIDDIISVIDPGNVPTDVMIDRILSAVSKQYGVSVDDIKSKRKNSNIANARHVAVYIIRTELDLSYPSIGKILNRDHSTIVDSFEKTKVNVRTKSSLASEVQTILNEIKG